jgi:type III pantothenate kinase
MIAHPESEDTAPGDEPVGLLVVDIGNSALHLAVWTDKGISDVRRVGHGDPDALAEALNAVRTNARAAGLVAAVVVTVVPDALPAVEDAIRASLDLDATVIGRDIPLPLTLAVQSPETVGGDRVCAAAAAYARVGGSCTVIDFGTAVTVDLVDDAGAFQGGAILPGLQMQAWALGTRAAALPVVSIEFPAQPVGRETVEAIRSGICHGLVGAVRNVVEQIATHLNHWPYVVATGGDLDLLAKHCDFIDAAFPDLCLHGVGLAYVKYLNAQVEEA